ncbi:hypothetical protein SAMN05444007_103393 [Cribrihabitans marinus]|uniref:Uncharacterized protein n=1 Tax=Cribrihabitans marinus TaxID=1227549 RepID=A0A1H6WL46_9RHOB|nr:hypothetical protein [Cribrihabitans marinus]GGH24459.1 hypothetical protein GCM10010973_10980 [Cribrihabitans marinus]SEJ13212.1 hypothetical protein SAMN05444007_103393 [Cribrihabitans marinus]
MPKLKRDFHAVPDGEIYPRWFVAGEEVTGSVAIAAGQEGFLLDEQNSKKSASRRKALKAAPENKAD